MRLLGLVGLLFLAGLGVGAIVASRSEGAPSPGAAANRGPATRLASTGGAPAPVAPRYTAQQPTGEISDARLSPTVIASGRVIPSVVTIRTTRTIETRVSFLDEFFGRRGGRRTVPGLGSGFAIDDRGHILTNHHVIRDADEIFVLDQNGHQFEAELVGSDELTDLAVLRIPPDSVPPAPLGTSSDLIVGEPAIAIGNPSGFQLRNSEATVTTGVVSGVGRDIESEGREVLYADMIQTDAAINPGNSGGPLVNADGNVIGVNSSIFSRSGGSEGLGFAIPIDRALQVASEMSEFGRVRRPWVGLDVVTDRARGMVPVVENVYDETPAAAAGLRPGDVIVALDGRPIRHDLDWQVALVDAGVGNRVRIDYRRGDAERSTELLLEELPSGAAERVEVLDGLRMVTVSPQIVRERDLAIAFGALIVDIEDDVARDTGLRQGDVIWGINGNEVRDVDEAAELFQYYARHDETQGWVRLHITRGTRSGTLRPFRVG